MMCMQVQRCTVCKRAMRIFKSLQRDAFTLCTENFDMSVYRNCVDTNLIQQVKIMVVRSLKYKKKYTVIVEKNAMSAISDKVYVRAESVRVLPNGNYPTFIILFIYLFKRKENTAVCFIVYFIGNILLFAQDGIVVLKTA